MSAKNRSTFPSSLSATVRFEKVRQRRTLWATLFDTVQNYFYDTGTGKVLHIGDYEFKALQAFFDPTILS